MNLIDKLALTCSVAKACPNIHTKIQNAEIFATASARNSFSTLARWVSEAFLNLSSCFCHLIPENMHSVLFFLVLPNFFFSLPFNLAQKLEPGYFWRVFPDALNSLDFFFKNILLVYINCKK
jgi:hypothetical protein